MYHMRALGNKTYCGRQVREGEWKPRTVYALETHRITAYRYPVGDIIRTKSLYVECSTCQKHKKDLLNIKRFRKSILEGRTQRGRLDGNLLDDAQYGFLDSMDEDAVVRYDREKNWEVIGIPNKETGR